MRRSRRKGQLRRGSFLFLGLHSPPENFFFFAPGLREDLSEWIGDERIPPEFDASIASRGIALVTDAIHHGNKNSIGDGVRTLNSAPGVELSRAEFSLLFRMPPDACRIENYLRALHRSEARALRIPLVPADLNADAAKFRVEI